MHLKNIFCYFIFLFFVFSFFTCKTEKIIVMEVGDTVPAFQANDQDGNLWKSGEHISKGFLVIYFYPAAMTGGCTKQACAYRDRKGELEKVNASVVGVSGDKPETLELFALQHQLNFTLLSDETGEIAAIFGVPQSPGGSIQRDIKGKTLNLDRGTTIQRWTFILDRKGTLIFKDSEVNASEDSSR